MSASSPEPGVVRDARPWSLETDAVVVGGGACGLTAALAAAEDGAETPVLECHAAAAGQRADLRRPVS
jgi:succinate dehydrogenase/fumarate reductase flavoprotein subunit